MNVSDWLERVAIRRITVDKPASCSRIGLCRLTGTVRKVTVHYTKVEFKRWFGSNELHWHMKIVADLADGRKVVDFTVLSGPIKLAIEEAFLKGAETAVLLLQGEQKAA